MAADFGGDLPGGEGAPTATVIVGGGFTGTVLALKLARARPGERVLLIERRRRAGVGLAYGACAPPHLLNVPVSRMEVGLFPSFAEWLRGCGADLSDALAESGGRLEDAFAPRALFGRYMEARLAEALSPNGQHGVQRVVGEAVRLLDGPRRGVALADGREIEGDRVVLATGNPAPHPAALGAALDGAAAVVDPWAPDAFEGLGREDAVLLVGAGLTAVDVALGLDTAGHRGRITAISRHGHAPQPHAAGGGWPRFLQGETAASPLAALRGLRAQLAAAAAAGVPWQRVFDAARPDVAGAWRGWSLPQRRRFLRHLRARWDVHRHRMAPRVANRLEAMRAEGRLGFRAGRLAGAEPVEGGVSVRLKLRGGGEETLQAARVVNCTGPRSDYDRLEAPLLAALRRAGLLRGDELGLGLVTQRCAVVGADGEPSPWLFALGGLTRPSLWEVTAVPEINAQVDAFVARLGDTAAASPLDRLFADLGAGI